MVEGRFGRNGTKNRGGCLDTCRVEIVALRACMEPDFPDEPDHNRKIGKTRGGD